ncbi:hypothetical protein I3760_16G106400 [Carya illinoinensis]|nr:hypothetical protein I3760_16G106400 [Carya illinoinensis]
MWKLKISKGGPDLVSINNFIGREYWEFDPNAGTPEEHAKVERAREEYKKNRYKTKQSSDLLMRMQRFWLDFTRGDTRIVRGVKGSGYQGGAKAIRPAPA